VRDEEIKRAHHTKRGEIEKIPLCSKNHLRSKVFVTLMCHKDFKGTCIYFYDTADFHSL
jgi:hypothetical protein